RLASSDVDRFRPIVDISVLPEAFQTSPGLRIESRRIACSDTHNTSRELLLTNNLVHVTVEYELHTLCASAELQTPRQRSAICAGALACNEASVLHHTWREVTRTGAGNSSVLFTDCSFLDVRSGAFHEKSHSPPRARHA